MPSPEWSQKVTPAAGRNRAGPGPALRLLSEGAMEVEGLIPWSSNATLLVTVRDGEESTLAIYKPQRGERPLWDFPHGGLGRREVATYLVDEALGWGLVPPTVLRDGPYGSGLRAAVRRGPGGDQLFHHPGGRQVCG